MPRHIKWIRYCLKKAQESKVVNYKHSSVLVKGGKIISIGINKMKSGCLADPCYEYKGWHSELDCLFNLDPKVINGSTLYVGGYSKGGNVLYSKPCKHCQEYLKKHKLKAIYFSNPETFFSKL